MAQIQHIVLFKFPEPLPEDEEREMFDMVRQFPEKIGGFVQLRIGADTSGRSRGYQYGMYSVFENIDRLRAYTPHPFHQAFSDWVFSRDVEILAFDYPIDDQTSVLEPA